MVTVVDKRLLVLAGYTLVFCCFLPASAWMGSMYRGREPSRMSPDYEDEPAIVASAPVPRTGMWYQQRRSAMDLLQDFPSDSGGCLGAACHSDDGCCENMICKTPESDQKKAAAPVGTCIPNPNEGLICKENSACGGGMECALTAGSRGFKTCQPKARNPARKQFNDDCRSSLECDQSRGLCCQQHRRHRQAPRQLCLYFKDSHNCIGFKKDYMDDSMSNKNKWWQY